MCELGPTHMNTETRTKHKRYEKAFKKSAVEHWLIRGKGNALSHVHAVLIPQMTINLHRERSSIFMAQPPGDRWNVHAGFDAAGCKHVPQIVMSEARKPITKIALKPVTNNFIQIGICAMNIIAALHFDNQKV